MALRILTVLTYYRPHWTGLTEHAAVLAEGLATRGHQVTVVTTRHRHDLPAGEDVNGVRVVRCRPVARVSRGMIAPGLLPTVIRLLASHDVLHLHTPLAEAGPLALAGRAAGRIVVITHHGDLVLPRGLSNAAVGALVNRSMTAAGHLASILTAYSHDYAGHSSFLLPFAAKTTVIAPPIALPPPNPDGTAAWRSAHGLTGRRIVGIAGRWVEEKGFDVLLRAWPTVQQRVPDAHLVFAGERNVVYERFYEHCAPLLAAARPHVTELGLLTDPEALANFYGGCDVFALPSRSECLARTQVEAMLCGTPVVATNIPGGRTAVRVTGMGLLVPPEHPGALADALVTVLERPDTFKRSRASVDAHYGLDQVVGAWEDLLAAHVQHRARPPLPQPARPVPPATRLDPGDMQRLASLQANELDIAFRRRTVKLLDFLAPVDGARVLDCGCGPGVHLQVVRAIRDVHVVGVDASAARLREAASRDTGARLTQVALPHLPFAPGTFDGILLAEVLEHVDDPHALLVALRDVLRPDGVLAISVPHANYPWLWDPINAVWTAAGGRPFRSGPLVGIWTNHVRLFTEAQLVACVREAGFEVECVEASTHACLPFHHFLVYGVGKPLIERGWLPRRMTAALDRGRMDRTATPAWHPVSLARRIVHRIDRRNDGPPPAGTRRFVNVLLKARRAAVDARTVAPAAGADAPIA